MSDQDLHLTLFVQAVAYLLRDNEGIAINDPTTDEMFIVYLTPDTENPGGSLVMIGQAGDFGNADGAELVPGQKFWLHPDAESAHAALELDKDAKKKGLSQPDPLIPNPKNKTVH